MWRAIALICVFCWTSGDAFAPPRCRGVMAPSTSSSSRLYFNWFGRKKEPEKDEETEEKDDSKKKSFFARFLDEPSDKEEKTSDESKDKDDAPTTELKAEAPAKEEKPPVAEKVEEPKVEETPLSKAQALKAQAERMRLEAEKMDAQLTLDKIERLEKELGQARKKGDSTKELQEEMDALQAKMRGETPAPPSRKTVPISKEATSTSEEASKTTSLGQPVDQQLFEKYLQEFEKAPDFTKTFMAGMVGLYDMENINATEVALRSEMRDRSDFSFLDVPKPEFTQEEIDKLTKNPLFKLRMASEKQGTSEQEAARKMLEEDYYTNLLAEKTGNSVGESFFEIEIRNVTDKDQLIESLYPKATRKEGQAPSMSQAMTLVTDVLPKASFNPSGKPEPVSGGFLIRGTSKLDDNDKLIEAIDAQLARTSLNDKVSVFFINDFTVFTEASLDSPDFTGESDPILFVTGPKVARESRRLLYSFISALGVGSSWYLSIYPFLLNPELMKRAEEQMSLADANMAYDLTWLTDLSLPLFITFMGIQLAHEAGHRAVAAIYGMNVTVPMFIPSVITGMTSTVTTFKSPPKNKEAMFDFAAAGPLTGIAASLAAMYFGLQFTVFSTAEAYSQFPALPLEILRQSTLGGGLVEYILGTGALSVPDGAAGTSAIANINIPLHPMAIAGYIGLIVNALSLLPIGTTDGGRMSMTLFGRGPKIVVGQIFLFLLFVIGFVGSDLFLFYFSFLIFFQQGNEIPARNEVDDISYSRVLLSTVAGVICLLTLIPIS